MGLCPILHSWWTTSQVSESWGVIHYGHLVKFASGFFLPVLYALIIISLGSQLATSEVRGIQSWNFPLLLDL